MLISKSDAHLPRLFFVILLAIVPSAFAQEIDGKALEDSTGLEEISGIIVDRTITLSGHEFYRHFSNYRQLRNPNSKFNLTVFERPSARWGSLIWVEYQSRKVFKTFLSPGRSSYKDVAESSARQIEEKLNKIKLRELLSDHIDLERDEL